MHATENSLAIISNYGRMISDCYLPLPKTWETKLPLVLSRGSTNFPLLFEIDKQIEIASVQVAVVVEAK